MQTSWRRFIFPVGLLAATFSLSACSHAGNVSAVSTDYNRAIARARSEQILLNVMRAGGREPLQFTAFGEITATVNRTVGIDTVATNLITGGRDAISPTLRLGGSIVPIVKIAPLANQDFITGLLRPITPDALGLFVNQGWDAEFLLPLVVQRYQCPNGNEVQGEQLISNDNAGVRPAGAEDLFLRQETEQGQTVSLAVSTERALELLRTGVAPGHALLGIAATDNPQISVVRVRQPGSSRWVVDLQSLCGGDTSGQLLTGGRGPGSIELRSPESILYYLGEVVRPCLLGQQTECAVTYRKGNETRTLFRVRSDESPDEPAVAVRMYGRRFWVARLDEADTDRTLKTISFLNQLIALQTNASTLNLTPTIITTSAGQ